jgi:hypothetical protein
MSAPHPAPPIVHHAPWKVWSNPIFRRYCQSRLRLHGLGITVLCAVLLAGFIVGMSNSISMREELGIVDAARTGIIPLLVLQGIILFILGTAQVSGGMVAERDEGVIDYQRLIPLTPLTKVVGYIFGLPIREYVAFLITVPFTAWSLWRGQVSWTCWLPLYTAFFICTLLYHFTGLVTGTVVKNRRWAFLATIVLVFSLYTIIPQLAKFGLVFCKYLTIYPVFAESLPGMAPASFGSLLRAWQRLAPTVRFFGLDFSEIVFTAFSQGGLILTFIIMLCRKWRRAESHLLGKLWATGFFVWIQFLLLGNALPLIDPGLLFPTRAFMGAVRLGHFWKPEPMEAVGMSALYGLVTLLLIFMLGGIISPSVETQLRGWRRARKQGASTLGPLVDAATGFWWVLVMVAAGAVGWFLFTRGLVESRWYPGHVVPLRTLAYFAAVLFAAGVGFQTLYEAKGGKVVGILTILVGVFPVMLGSVLSVLPGHLEALGIWIAGLSPATLPGYGAASLLSISDLPKELARAMPRAFYFWLMVGLLATAWLIVHLWKMRREMARSVLAAAAPAESPVLVSQ